jgi:Tol biopolymer transport system component
MNIKRIMSVITTYKFMRFISVFTLFLAIMTNFACWVSVDDLPEPAISHPPALTDAIPYEKLKNGKLVFERNGNSVHGFYIVDIDEQRSWGIGKEEICWAPAASPNGTKIAYISGFSVHTQYDILVMNIDGANSQKVSGLEGSEMAPSWTPDSRQIVFCGSVEWSPTPLYRQSPVPNPPDRILIRYFSYKERPRPPFSVSPNGKLVFIATKEGVRGICTMDIDGSNFELLIPIPSATGIDLYSPAWSPGGQKIAYLSVLKDSNDTYKSLEIIVIDADGGNPISLAWFETNGSGQWAFSANVLSLCWSPDGSMIAFNKKEGHLASHIYVINSDGSELTQVTFMDGVTDESLSWSN